MEPTKKSERMSGMESTLTKRGEPRGKSFAEKEGGLWILMSAQSRPFLQQLIIELLRGFAPLHHIPSKHLSYYIRVPTFFYILHVTASYSHQLNPTSLLRKLTLHV